MIWKLALCIVLGYFLGCFNGAIIVSTAMHDDVRNHGSGNAGLTNFLRNYGGWRTLLVVLIDMGKVAVACLLAGLLLPERTLLAHIVTGAAAQVGHTFPVIYSFHGGKGILCSSALCLILDWRVFLICFVVFLILFFTTRYVSLGSIAAAILFSAGLMTFHFSETAVWVIALCMSVLAIYMHRTNIVRLVKGTEKKTYFHRAKN